MFYWIKVSFYQKNSSTFTLQASSFLRPFSGLPLHSFTYFRRTTGRIRKLLPLRIPRVYEEPCALPDHRGPGRNQRHQVRTNPRLFTVQVARRHGASVRPRRRHAGTVRLPQPAALLPGAPKPQPVGLRVPAERAGTLLLAQLGEKPEHHLPSDASVRAHAAARWILVTSAGTRSPLLQLHRPHTCKHVQFAQRAARHVNSLVFIYIFVNYRAVYIL